MLPSLEEVVRRRLEGFDGEVTMLDELGTLVFVFFGPLGFVMHF